MIAAVPMPLRCTVALEMLEYPEPRKEQTPASSMRSVLRIDKIHKITTQMQCSFVHIVRCKGSNLQKVNQGKFDGKRMKGRKERRWFDQIKALIGLSTQ